MSVSAWSQELKLKELQLEHVFNLHGCDRLVDALNELDLPYATIWGLCERIEELTTKGVEACATPFTDMFSSNGVRCTFFRDQPAVVEVCINATRQTLINYTWHTMRRVVYPTVVLPLPGPDLPAPASVAPGEALVCVLYALRRECLPREVVELIISAAFPVRDARLSAAARSFTALHWHWRPVNIFTETMTEPNGATRELKRVSFDSRNPTTRCVELEREFCSEGLMRQKASLDWSNSLAIHCGASNLFVIDVESHDGGLSDWAAIESACGGPFDTLTVRSGTGGLHIYFKMPESSSSVTKPRVRPFFVDGRSVAIDIRAGDAFIFAPGSRYTTQAGVKRTYAVLRNTSPAHMPDALHRRLVEMAPFDADFGDNDYN
jgi:hypothetical protein